MLVTHREEQQRLLGPFPVPGPHWPEVGSVNTCLAAVLGVPTLVLRLLDVRGGGHARGGHVTYHAEALSRPLSGPVGMPVTRDQLAQLLPHPRRAGYATVAGLSSALAWAEAELRALGRPVTGPVEQVKTWNLAGLCRLPTAAGSAWLKTGRAFSVDEAAAIALLRGADPSLAPEVLAADPARRLLLLEHVAGEDCWDPSVEAVAQAVPGLARAQAALAARFADSTPPGLPDRSPRALVELTGHLLAGPAGAELTGDERTRAGRLVERLPALVERLARCGLPNTLLHGDFHPGNWRSDGRHTVLVDFADSCFGHPALDGLRPRAFTSPERWRQAADAWTRSWRELVPGCDPVGALRLAEPLAHLADAVRYQEFLDGIEPSEQRYHAGDPAAGLRAALTAFEALPA
ncbi:hypothetical protein GCM10009665_43440 [Kitasatospora nipponensis]|uniref:Aminoglycoside phosphotransferase domain-containing protein n=1 Tax=Kitasatospora nipponensis TaxID=258049 RepID=A0ABN1WEI3_9ACTN